MIQMLGEEMLQTVLNLKNDYLEQLVIKRRDKEKYVYSGYRTKLDSATPWSFSNDTVRNVVIFKIDNSSLSHSDNRNNKFLALREFPTFRTNGSFDSQRERLVLILVKREQNFALVYIIKLIIVICLLIEK